jgi:hypothetical protein
VLGGELVVERLGVVVVDEHERLAGCQTLVDVEDHLVATGPWLGADVDLGVVGGHDLLLSGGVRDD